MIPRHQQFSQGLKLGLTLPACTLPLVLIVGVMSALTQRQEMATLAGISFAIMFSLRTLWDSTHELDAQRRVFLARIAHLSPYLTALLLLAGALIIWRTGG